MKKLIYSLVVLLSVVSFSYGQEVNNVALSNGKEALLKSKVSGEFEFKFGSDRTKESVDKGASYYTQYFTVDFNEGTDVAKIKLIENTPSARMVVARFLSYNQVRKVKVDSEELSISDFIDLYLK
jgi:hypothetical protein